MKLIIVYIKAQATVKLNNKKHKRDKKELLNTIKPL
jgi:hypothetical protein